MVGNYIFETHFDAADYWFAAIGLALVFGRARCLKFAHEVACEPRR
jgi:branched-subunit amino acid ABC-type transport system permease component